MKIPNGENAVIDPGKLECYCLSPTHETGGEKAHLFEKLLGITRKNSQRLRDALLDVVANSDAAQLGKRNA